MAKVLSFACVITASLTAQQERPKATLRGKVTGHGDGRARVTVWHNDMRRPNVEPFGETMTAADGSFVLADVPWFQKQEWGFHSFLLVARAGNKVGVVHLRGHDAATDGLAVALAAGIDLRGVLRDEVSGKPIAGAWVYPWGLGQRDDVAYPVVTLVAPLLPWRAQTDAEGRFVLRGLPDMGPYWLMAGGEHHARLQLGPFAATDEVDETLQAGGRIQGRVLQPAGTPAVRAFVRTTSNGAGYGTAWTDEEGRFTLSSLGPGTFKVWADVDDLTCRAALDIEVAAGATVEGKDVQLVVGGFIVGRILDADTGKPFVPGPHTDVAMYGPARGSGGACECTPVLADGTFRIRAPGGTNRIYLRAAGGYREPSENVEVVEGRETEVVWRVRKGAGR